MVGHCEEGTGMKGQVPGVGPLTSAILVAHLPELGQKALTALAGLAPWSLITTAGNKMTITVDLAHGAPSAGSRIAAPVTILRSGQVASARVHLVRSIDASKRVLAPAGETGPEDVDAVIDKLQALLSRPLESSPTLENGSVLSVQDDLRACYGSLANVALDYALCQYLPTLPSVTPPTGTLRRRFIVEYRAAGRCEWCGAVNYQPHPDTGSKVVLTIAHVWDKRPEQASLLNLAALCQRCHLNWDRREHGFNRLRNRIARLMRQGQIPLCLPP